MTLKCVLLILGEEKRGKQAVNEYILVIDVPALRRSQELSSVPFF